VLLDEDRKKLDRWRNKIQSVKAATHSLDSSFYKVYMIKKLDSKFGKIK
jgi:hypothetical protein